MDTLRNRITPLAFAIVFICFLLSTFVSLWSLRTMAAQNMQELSKVLAARICDTISSELAQPIVSAQTMAHDRLLARVLEDEAHLGELESMTLLRDYLTGIRDGMGCESAFVIPEVSRRYYTCNGIGKIVDPQHNAYDRWYQAFIDSNAAWALDMDRDELSEDVWTVFVNARMEDKDGALLAVCGLGVRMTGSQNLFSELEKEFGVRIHLIDRDRVIQVAANEERIESALSEEIRLSGTGDYIYQRLSADHFVVTRYIDWLGWHLVVESDGSQSKGQFINVIVLNIGLCLLVMVILVIAMRIIALRAQALAQASFRDQATQLLNRRAFEDEKAQLMCAALPQDFVYVTADVNGLKTVNDTLGHAAGDELIKGAAACLKSAFSPHGKIYRIGGDEFAAMLNLSAEKLPQVIENLEAAVAGWSGEKVESLSISCGYAMSREFPSENIAELSRISDERMYAAKEAYYQKIGKPRRRT